jgi:hypothetical protein
VPSAGRPSRGTLGREIVRQYSVLKQHRREQIYNIAGNHDASPHGIPSSEGKEANWWFRKWADPLGEHPETSLVDNAKRPYPIDGTWERYTFKFGNVRVLMMSDRNDLPYPVGRKASGGASPAGAVTPETFEWWKGQVERARANDEIIISCHHHMLRETTVGSGDFEGVQKNPDGTYRRGKYHGADGAPEGASYLYFLGDKPKAQAFEGYMAEHPSAVDLWLGGHTHTSPDDVRPLACRKQMGRQFRQLCAIVEVPLDRDLSADEPPLHLHRGLQTGARAVLPSRRHLRRAGMVSAGGARSRVFQGVLLELKSCSEGRVSTELNKLTDPAVQQWSRVSWGQQTCLAPQYHDRFVVVRVPTRHGDPEKFGGGPPRVIMRTRSAMPQTGSAFPMVSRARVRRSENPKGFRRACRSAHRACPSHLPP